MPFPESLKLELRRRAAFRCCRCQAIGVEIHHIVPEAQGGASSLENAAPLCAKCHADFGDNAQKRKEIREMRDWWYQRVETQFGGSNPQYQVLEEKLDALLEQVTGNRSGLDQIKAVLKTYVSVLIDQIDASNVRTVVTNVVNTPKPPFLPGSPCQMAGQPCPACSDGVMDVDSTEAGVQCNRCGLFIAAVAPQRLGRPG